MTRIRSVLITGASSGIGRALALAYAAPGVTVHLGGRDAARLEEVATSCRAAGAASVPRTVDVRDAAAMAAWIAEAGQLDLVVANAGISAGTGAAGLEAGAQSRAIFAVNLDGMLNTVLPALEAMRGQPSGRDGVRGRIAVIASMAGFVAVPGTPAYSASKAAADTWTLAMAPAARRQGVLMSSVCPGWIRTPMTANNRFPMPGLMEPARAARLIQRGVAAGRMRVMFPRWLGWAARFAGALPPRLAAAVLGRAEAKDVLAPDRS